MRLGPFLFLFFTSLFADRGVSEVTVAHQGGRAAGRKRRDAGGQLPPHPAAQWQDCPRRLPVTFTFLCHLSETLGPTHKKIEGNSFDREISCPRLQRQMQTFILDNLVLSQTRNMKLMQHFCYERHPNPECVLLVPKHHPQSYKCAQQISSQETRFLMEEGALSQRQQIKPWKN